MPYIITGNRGNGIAGAMQKIFVKLLPDFEYSVLIDGVEVTNNIHVLMGNTDNIDTAFCKGIEN